MTQNPDAGPSPVPMPEPEALAALLDAVETVYERWQQLSEELYAETPATCFKGCGTCCHFPLIPATAGEAFVLFHLLRQMASDREALDAHLVSYATRYLNHARRQGSLPFTDAQQKAAFDALKLPCPLFVSEGEGMEGHCGAFSLRPLICGYFHSLDAPELCASKAPHGTSQQLIATGEEAVDELLSRERMILGRSTLGHLPLLLAAFTTEAGRQALLRTDFRDADTEILPPEEAQATCDFSLYVELLSALGYALRENDIASLIRAQEERAQP